MKLKAYHISLIILVFIIGCNAVKTNEKLKSSLTEDTGIKPDTIEIANDSLEYKIIIIDIGFNAWLQTQRPRGFYSQNFLENRNQQYVTAYNNRFMEASRYPRDLYPFLIDYDFKTDYGYEVNYLLYHYFLFFEETYNQKLR